MQSINCFSISMLYDIKSNVMKPVLTDIRTGIKAVFAGDEVTRLAFSDDLMNMICNYTKKTNTIPQTVAFLGNCNLSTKTMSFELNSEHSCMMFFPQKIFACDICFDENSRAYTIIDKLTHNLIVFDDVPKSDIEQMLVMCHDIHVNMPKYVSLIMGGDVARFEHNAIVLSYNSNAMFGLDTFMYQKFVKIMQNAQGGDLF